MDLRALTSSRRFVRLLTWAGAIVLAVGVTTFLIVVFGDDGKAPLPLEPSGNQRVSLPKTPEKAPLDQRARVVAGKFILTAVARKNMDESWEITHPSLRAGYTRRQWKKGDIPVVPFPINNLEQARFKVDQSYKNEVLLEVALIPNKNSDVEAGVFFIGLKAVGNGQNRRWLVDYWMPRWNPGIRTDLSQR